MKNHAVVMTKFAHDCRTKASELFQKLDLTLGPGTADLNIRIGCHSGPGKLCDVPRMMAAKTIARKALHLNLMHQYDSPVLTKILVTAGVLRGERSRFQLFGDTVNVAARMESNG